MTRYLLRRLLGLLPVALGVVTLTFSLIHLTPGDPVIAMLGENAAPADIEEMRHQLGLDRPLIGQYGRFLRDLARADLGTSITTGIPIASLIKERFPATLELAGAAMGIAVLLAFPLGIIAGATPRGIIDLLATGIGLLGVAIPHLCLGPLLMIVLALKLGWLPLTGRGGLAHLVMPALTLGLGMAAILVRMLRQSLIDVSERDFMRVARAKGLGRTAALLRHGLRNALTPVVSILGLEAGALLTGSIIVEQIFAWPGLGRLLIEAINTRDYPLVEGCVLVFSLSYVVVNVLVDLAYSLIDPRIRL